MIELTGYRGSDFYCDVALPNVTRLEVMAQTERTLAYLHTRPFWPVHVVVIPKRHIASFTTITAADEADVRDLLAVAQQVAADVEQQHGAARVLTNLGSYQDSKHLHVHVSSGDELPRAPGD